MTDNPEDDFETQYRVMAGQPADTSGSESVESLVGSPIYNQLQAWHANERQTATQNAVAESAHAAEQAGMPVSPPSPRVQAKSATPSHPAVETVANPFLAPAARPSPAESLSDAGMVGSGNLPPESVAAGDKRVQPLGMLAPEESKAAATQMRDEAPRNLREAEDRLAGDEKDLQEFDAKLAAGTAPYSSQFTHEQLRTYLKQRIGAATKARDEAVAAARHAEDIASGKAPMPTEAPWRSAAENVVQTALTTATSPVKWAGIAAGYVGYEAGLNKSIDQNAIYQFGEKIDSAIKQAYPGDPSRQFEAGTKLAHAAGFMASLYGTGALARLGPAFFAKAAPIGMAGTAGGVSQFEEANATPGTSERAKAGAAAAATVVGGIFGGLPVERILGAPVQSGAGAMATAAAGHAAVSSAAMAGYTLASNAIAKGFYDPDRDIAQGVGESALIGAVFGGVGSAVSQAVRSRYSTPEEIDAFLKGVQDRTNAERAAQNQPIFDWMHAQAREAGVQGRLLPAPGDATQAPEAPPSATGGMPAPEPSPRPSPQGAGPEAAIPATSAPEPSPSEPSRAWQPPAGAPEATGPRTISTPDNSMRVQAAPEVVELSSLKYATDALQPRDRGRQESEIGIKERAANLDPARLQPSPVSDTGAPIVGQDGTILSGNGRGMSIAEVYGNEALKEKADAYRASLGPAADGMKEPVLVMRLPQDMPQDEMRRFADLSNRSSIAQMSATERAQRDAKALSAPAGGVASDPATGQPAAAVEPGIVGGARGGAAEGGQPVPGRELSSGGGNAGKHDEFRAILAGPAKRSEWAGKLGLSEAELGPLIEEKIAQGLLRRDRNGVVRRTAAAKPKAEPEGQAYALSGFRDRAAEKAGMEEVNVAGKTEYQYPEKLVNPSRDELSDVLIKINMFTSEWYRSSPTRMRWVLDQNGKINIGDNAKFSHQELGLGPYFNEPMGFILKDGTAVERNEFRDQSAKATEALERITGKPVRFLTQDEIDALSGGKDEPQGQTYALSGQRQFRGTFPEGVEAEHYAMKLTDAEPFIFNAVERGSKLDRVAVDLEAGKVTDKTRMALGYATRDVDVLAKKMGLGTVEQSAPVEIALHDAKQARDAMQAAYDAKDAPAFRMAARDFKAATAEAAHARIEVVRQRSEPKAFDYWIENHLPEGVKAALSDQAYAITAYHGSPYDFDRFDISKIGKGEGAQAFGHGLYFAEREGIAKYYKEQLSGNKTTIIVDGKAIHSNNRTMDWLIHQLADDIRTKADKDGVFEGDWLDGYKEDLEAMLAKGTDTQGHLLPAEDVLDMHRTISFLDNLYGKRLSFQKAGRLYTVSLDVEPHELLDWDKPLSADAINKIEKIPELAGSDYFKKWMRDPDVTGRDVYESIGNVLSGGSGKNHAGHIATGVLHEAGIPGIRYLDQGSRTSGEGSHNFVIFDHNKVKVTAKDGKPVLAKERKDILDQSQQAFAITHPKDTGVNPHYIQAKIRTSIEAGRTHEVDPLTVAESHAVIMAHADEIPREIQVGTVTHIEPMPGGTEVRFVFETPRGEVFTMVKSKADLFRNRAVFDPGEHVVALLELGGLGAPHEVERTLSGGIRHEGVHANRFLGKIGAGEWEFLLGHAEENLQSLDWDLYQWHQLLGRGADLQLRGVSVRSQYEDAYAAIPEPKRTEYMNQEAVAHMVEGYHHISQLPRDHPLYQNLMPLYRPVEPLLRKMLSGEVAARTDEDVARIDADAPVSAIATESREDRQTGREMRRDLDALGYYSAALEAAKGLKQAKGTPEQMLAQLKKAGAKDAEIDAAGLAKALEGKKSVTRNEIVKHLEENRVGLKEAGRRRYSDAEEDRTKWQDYSLDPNNPTYRETVLHLPENRPPQWVAVSHPDYPSRAALKNVETGEFARAFDGSARVFANQEGAAEYAKNGALEHDDKNFRSGHFPEPNITGHMMTSLVKDGDGKPVFLVDQIQSDWGQRLRDKGVRDEAKIYRLESEIPVIEEKRNAIISKLKTAASELNRKRPNVQYGDPDFVNPYDTTLSTEGGIKRVLDVLGDERLSDEYNTVKSDRSRLQAELSTAKSASSSHPLVNTTSQWVTTTLRRAINQAIEAGADKIAIPSGDTVLSYNPGDKHGMNEFYNKIVPLALKKVMRGHDAAYPEPGFAEKLETPTRGEVNVGGQYTPEDYYASVKGPAKFGFTVFPITPAVKESVKGGQPLFALSGEGKGRGTKNPAEEAAISSPEIKALSEIIADLKSSLGMPFTQGLNRLNITGAQSGRSRTFRAKPDIKATYEPGIGIARGRLSTDIESIAHEGGHHLETIFGKPFEDIKNQYRGELEPMAYPGASDKLSEGFSEFFRQYITNPNVAKAQAPGFHDEFEDFLDAHDPKMLQDFDHLLIAQASADYQNYLKATTVDRGMADIVSHSDRMTSGGIRQFFKDVGQNDTVSGYASRVFTAFVDRTHPIYMMTRALLKTADINQIRDANNKPISLAVHENPYKLIRSMNDAYKTAMAWIQQGMPNYRHSDATVPGQKPHRSASLFDALHMAMGDKWTDEGNRKFGVYLESRRAVEEWKNWDAKQKRMTDLTEAIRGANDSDVKDVLRHELELLREKGLQRPPHRVKQAEHEDRIRALEVENQKYPQAAQMVYDFLWQSAVHDFQAGRLSKAELDYRETRKHFFVPFARDISDIAPGREFLGGGKRFAKDKAFKGNDRAIYNPIETIVDQTFHRAAATHFNDVMRALGNLADRAGPGSAAIAEKLTKRELVNLDPDGLQRLTDALVAQGYDPHDAADMAQRVASDWGDMQAFLSWTPEKNPGQPMRLPLWENGERNYLQINDHEFAAATFQAINGLGSDLKDFWFDMVQAPALLIQSNVWSSLAFSTRHAIRTMWVAWMQTGSALNPRTWPMVNQAYGLRDELMHTDFAKLYQEVAGSQGGINKSIMSNKADKVDVLHLKEKGIRYNPKTLIPAALAGGIAGYAGAAALGVGATASGGAIAAAAFFGAGFHRGIKKLPETLAHFADIMEMATRLGVARYAYKAALANNPSLTPYQAMQEAAYASRNIFDGSRKGSRMLSIVRLVPFMNAHEQHVVVSLEKFIGRHDRGLGMSPVKMGGAMTVAFTGATLAAGPIAGVAAAAATPIALMTAAQRSEAVRLAMRPFFKQAEGAPLSNEERRALGDSAKMWSNYVLYALLMFALSQLRGDDEKSDQEYEMVKDQLHEQWVPFKIGDTWYKTPLAFQLGTGYIILKAAFDAQINGDPHMRERVLEGLYETMMPPVYPQALRLFQGFNANYDEFRRRPIVPEFLRKLPPDQQYNEYTSQLAIKIAEAINADPHIRSATETMLGTAFHNKHLEISPLLVDFAIGTSLGYWGRDAQKASDFARPGGPWSTDIMQFPIIGTALQQYQLDPYRQSQAVQLFFDKMAKAGEGYPRAAAGYDALLRQKQDVGAANAYLAALPEDQRNYALFQEQSSKDTKGLHPLNRAADIAKVAYAMQHEIVGNDLRNTEDKAATTNIPLGPDKAQEVRNLITQAMAIELHNTFAYLKVPEMTGRREMDVHPTLDVLKASHPEVHAEYERRLERAKVQNWDIIKDQFPEMTAILNQEWQDAIANNTAMGGVRKSKFQRAPTPVH